jgi:uncharacterized protein
VADHFGCVRNTIRLRSGLYFDLADPQPDQFRLSDIAGALAKICRFGGQANAWYSVAEHSCHCADQADADGLTLGVRRAALMHDAAEAFCGDVVKPLKVLLRNYAGIESSIEAVIGDKYGIDFDAHREAIRKIDREMLIAERRALFTPDKIKWTREDSIRCLSLKFCCWTPKMAEQEFYQRLTELKIWD